jgi:hypothetical protein
MSFRNWRKTNNYLNIWWIAKSSERTCWHPPHDLSDAPLASERCRTALETGNKSGRKNLADTL